MNFESLDLNAIWFVLIGVLLTGYAMLDGFDLGVGALHLFARGDQNRRLMMNSIGPVWDGNEVWLVVGGGALFAAFPDVYATVFSGFYLAFMLLLVALIFRAVAIEFRGKQAMGWWRNLWDVSFSLSSILSSILIGVALGNLIWGRDIVADLKGSLDAVAVSLNTTDPQDWIRLHAPSKKFENKGFASVLMFIKGCVKAGLKTTVTAVELPGTDMPAVRRLAAGLGASFRARPAL